MRVEKQQAHDQDYDQSAPSKLAEQPEPEVPLDEVGDILSDLEPVSADPPFGSDCPWTPRELEFLSMSRFDLELLSHDGEELPPRVVAKLFAHYRRRCRDELVRIFR